MRKKIATWVYLAGIMDGEGCLNCAHTHQYFVRLSVGSTNKKLLDWLKQHFGGSIYIPLKCRGENRKRVDLWQASNTDIGWILRGVLPYLIVKKKQAMLLLRFRKTMSPGRPLKTATIKCRERIYMQMKILNQRGREGKEKNRAK